MIILQMKVDTYRIIYVDSFALPLLFFATAKNQGASNSYLFFFLHEILSHGLRKKNTRCSSSIFCHPFEMIQTNRMQIYTMATIKKTIMWRTRYPSIPLYLFCIEHRHTHTNTLICTTVANDYPFAYAYAKLSFTGEHLSVQTNALFAMYEIEIG